MTPDAATLVNALAVPGFCLAAGVANTLLALKMARTREQRRLLVRFNIIFWTVFTLFEGLPLGLVGAGIAPKWILIPCSIVFFVFLGLLVSRIRRRKFTR